MIPVDLWDQIFSKWTRLSDLRLWVINPGHDWKKREKLGSCPMQSLTLCSLQESWGVGGMFLIFFLSGRLTKLLLLASFALLYI